MLLRQLLVLMLLLLLLMLLLLLICQLLRVVAVQSLQPLLLALEWSYMRQACHARCFHSMPGGRLGIHARTPRGLKGGGEAPVVWIWHLRVGIHVHSHAIAIHSLGRALVGGVVGVHVGHVVLCGGVRVTHGGLCRVQVIVHGGWLMAVLLLVVKGLCRIGIRTLYDRFDQASIPLQQNQVQDELYRNLPTLALDP